MKIQTCRSDAAKGWYEDLALPKIQSLPVALPWLAPIHGSTTPLRTGGKLPVAPRKASLPSLCPVGTQGIPAVQ